MVVQPRLPSRALRRVANSLPDDTEESIVGLVSHQFARDCAVGFLRNINYRRRGGWGVYPEVGLSGLFHRDGSTYTPRPDVVVFGAPVDVGLAEVALAEVGDPLLIVEVASESTWRNDVGDKRDAYAAAGVREYIVFDPAGDYLGESVRAWRLNATNQYTTWAAVDGMWESAALEVDFFVEGQVLRVRDRDGWEPAPSDRAAADELDARQRADAAETQARQESARADAEAQARALAEEQARRESEGRRQAEAENARLLARIEHLQHRDDA